MRFSRLTPGLLAFCVGLALCSCKPPADPQHTFEEVQLLVSRLNAQPVAGNFSDLDLIAGISNDTLEFLAQDFSDAEVRSAVTLMPGLRDLLLLEDLRGSEPCNQAASSGARVKNTGLLQALRKRLSRSTVLDPRAGIYLEQNALPNLPKATLSPAVLEALRVEYEKLKKENKKIFGSEKLDNITYCPAECSCIANHLGAAVKRTDPSLPLLYLTVTGGCAAGGVCPVPPPGRDARGRQASLTSWTHHVTLLVGDGKGGWVAVDPMLFGNTEGHATNDWYSQLQHDYPSRYHVSPAAKTIGSDYIPK